MPVRIVLPLVLVCALSCVLTTEVTAQAVAGHEYASIEPPQAEVAAASVQAAGRSAGSPPGTSAVVHDPDIIAATAEVEALYGTGVMANIDHRWHDAELAFEQALAILGELDSPAGDDSLTTAYVDSLFNEIATDYRETLIALGELDGNASISAVLLRFDGDGSLVEPGTLELPPEKTPVSYDFPIEMNDKVRNCIVYYQTVAREPFEEFLTRAGRYLPMMKEIVASYDLPTDLAYLPLVESGFNNKAYSYAHAAGPWQFISSTGHNYGLHRSWWLDERRDFEKSTHAACKYLGDLYRRFESWPLALASYNGGEGRVSRQIKRQRTHDFWKLRLHRQTRNYVPLFMAALLIAKDPQTYGFSVEPDPPLAFDWAATNKALELKDIARALGCSREALIYLNPELRRYVTPPDVKPYRLRVPAGLGERFAAVYKTLPASARTEWVRHKVRRGESVSGLARRYGVRVSAIVRANKLRSAHRISVGQTLTIPVPLAYADARPQTPTAARSSVPAGRQKYVVRRGDSLWKLAKKFGTTTSAIRRANNMGSRSKLIAGRTILIPQKRSSSKRHKSFWYTIRRGDTISRIAQKFGVSIRRILGANALHNPNRIRVGQRIRIPKGM